jgi:hypothetical protein
MVHKRSAGFSRQWGRLSSRPVALYATVALFVVCFLCTGSAQAQDNYEIQVYSSDTVPKNNTMVELHSNFTAKGSQELENGVYPTNRTEHETLEITRGVSDWAEVGFYLFTAVGADHGWDWVGDHIRPRVRVPDSWHLPVGLSLSGEIGYQRPVYSADTWTLELRPIIDKKFGRWYASFNPTLERSLRGINEKKGFEFSPNAKISYDFRKWIAGGLEYYGAVGPLSGFDHLRETEQQFFPAVDLNVSPRWEINFGVGLGVTSSTDRLILKAIIGRRFGRAPEDEVPGTKGNMSTTGKERG